MWLSIILARVFVFQAHANFHRSSAITMSTHRVQLQLPEPKSIGQKRFERLKQNIVFEEQPCEGIYIVILLRFPQIGIGDERCRFCSGVPPGLDSYGDVIRRGSP